MQENQENKGEKTMRSLQENIAHIYESITTELFENVVPVS